MHGKYQMNVAQIGAAFVATESLGERMREFRSSRVAQIESGGAPVALLAGRRVTVHLIPISTFANKEKWPVTQLQQASGQSLKPITCTYGWSQRVNLDGFLRHSGSGSGSRKYSYVQLFRSGAIEACDTCIIGGVNSTSIPSVLLEESLNRSLGEYLQVQRSLGVEAPVVLMVTLEGVRGAQLAVYSDPGRNKNEVVDRNQLLLPEVVIEDLQENSGRILRPVFDSIYNSAGYENCPRYNTAGDYDRSLAP